MAMALHYAARSDIGLGRYKNNQDSGYAGPHLLVVADGMGGAAGGDVASSMVIGELVQLDADVPGPDAERDLVAAVVRANETMHERVSAQADLQGMGSTVTALLSAGNRLLVAHVGDSRAYRLRDGNLEQLTHDHTFVQRLIDSGEITVDEAERHPQRSVILRVVGHMDETDVDVRAETPQLGDRWLLCSDGLPRVISDETIQEALASGAGPEATADTLVGLALRAGGPDNITVIVADVVDPARGTAPLAPQVVGAAALHQDRRSRTADTAAGRAARLTESDPGSEDGPALEPGLDDGERKRGRWWRRSLALLSALLLILVAGIGARQWLRNQYYVGTAQDHVTIYRGLDAKIGPVLMSEKFEESTLPVSALTDVNRRQVTEGLPSGSLTKVRNQLKALWAGSTLCTGNSPTTEAGEAPTPATTATPTSASTGDAGGTLAASPSSDTSMSATSTPSPSGTATTRPTECP